MGMLGSEPDDPVEAMVERARGDSVTETKLTRVGNRMVRQGTLEDRPVVDYLREDEQPHHILFASNHEFGFDGEDHAVNTLYWQTLVVTDQRLLVLVGDNGGDTGEVIPYETIDPYSLDARSDSITHDELRLVAGGVECEFEVHSKIGIDELRAAAEYIRKRAANADRTPERERSRGPVYEIPNLDVEATVWRPDGGEDEREDDGVDDERGNDEHLGDNELDSEKDEREFRDDEEQTPDPQIDLPEDAHAGVRANGLDFLVFDRRLRVEGRGEVAEIPLACVSAVNVEDGAVAFEFDFGSDGRAAKRTEIEVETDRTAAFESIAEEIEARQSGEVGDDAETVEALHEWYDASEAWWSEASDDSDAGTTDGGDAGGDAE